MGSIHPAVSEICDPQSLDPICTKFDKFLGHGQAHLGQMGKWPWRCTTTGLDNSTELRMEKIHQAVTEIWVPQVWQPPGRPAARTVTTIPLQPGGLRGKKWQDTENQESCQLGCHWWHWRLSLWQHPVPTMMTKLASWQLQETLTTFWPSILNHWVCGAVYS